MFALSAITRTDAEPSFNRVKYIVISLSFNPNFFNTDSIICIILNGLAYLSINFSITHIKIYYLQLIASKKLSVIYRQNYKILLTFYNIMIVLFHIKLWEQKWNNAYVFIYSCSFHVLILVKPD